MTRLQTAGPERGPRRGSRHRSLRGVHRVRRVRTRRTRDGASSCSSPSRPARSRPTRSSPACARKLAQIAGISTYLISRQDVNVGGRLARTAVPVHGGGREPRRAARVGASRARRDEEDPAAQGRQHRPADRRARARRRDRPRHGLAPRRHRAGHRRRALRRVRPGARRDDLHAAQRVLRRDGGGRSRIATRPTRSTTSTCGATPGRRFRCEPSPRCTTASRRSRSTTTASSRR